MSVTLEAGEARKREAHKGERKAAGLEGETTTVSVVCWRGVWGVIGVFREDNQ